MALLYDFVGQLTLFIRYFHVIYFFYNNALFYVIYYKIYVIHINVIIYMIRVHELSS